MDRSEIGHWSLALKSKSQVLPHTIRKNMARVLEILDAPVNSEIPSKISEIEIEMQQINHQLSEMGIIYTMLMDGMRTYARTHAQSNEQDKHGSMAL